MKKIGCLIVLFIANFCYSQEFLADVQVDFSQVQTGNNQIFKTLETSLKSFINTTKWTEKEYKTQEKIRCSFTIVVNKLTSNENFEASLIVQYRRPIFNSTYNSPLLNCNDTKFNFRYTEFEPLIFNPRKFSGKNLTDVIGFYLHYILALDGDSFSPSGGQAYYLITQNIADNAQNQGFEGWNLTDGYRTRASLISDTLKPQNAALRLIIYGYHRNGLDMISTSEYNSKNQVISALNQLTAFQNTFQFYALDLFLNTKKQEIADIFSGGLASTGNIVQMKELLKTISPINSADFWDKIKN